MVFIYGGALNIGCVVVGVSVRCWLSVLSDFKVEDSLFWVLCCGCVGVLFCVVVGLFLLQYIDLFNYVILDFSCWDYFCSGLIVVILYVYGIVE